MKAPIFLITPVKYDMQQMLILKVASENVAKVRKLPFMNFRYVFAYNFYKQHLLHVKLYKRNEKNMSFHLISKTPFRWMNPKVIESYTFNKGKDLNK